MMEVFKDIPIKQYQSFARHEPVVLDATALKLYKGCPRAYFYRMVLGFTEKDTAPYFAFGSAYHKYREGLDKAFAAGANWDECNLVAVAMALEVFKKKMPSDPPIGSRYDYMTRNRLLASLEKAFDWWKKEREANVVQVVATEQFFKLELKDGTILGGRADRRIVKNGNRRWGQDYKTSSKTPAYYVRTLYPNDQFALYTYAETILDGERVRGQMVEVLYNDRKKGPSIQPYPVEFTDSQLKEWEQDLTEWTERIKISRERDSYPMVTNNCSFCPFHMVCSGLNDNAKTNMLQARFDVSPWDCSAEDL